MPSWSSSGEDVYFNFNRPEVGRYSRRNHELPSSNGNGAYLTASGIWTNTSSRAKKTDFDTLDPISIVEKLVTVPVDSWRYRGEEGVLHMGPTAEDFYAAFSLGNSDKHISTVDADGVALAAIKGLYEIVKKQQAQIDALQACLLSEGRRCTSVVQDGL